MCTRTVPMRRSLWDTGAGDASGTLASTLPAGAMPTHLCVEYFHDLTGINRQVKIPRPPPPPTPKKVAVKTTHTTVVHHTSTGGGGGGFIAGGEPCTASRSIVWAVAVSQWAVPPGCFGGIYRVNPYAYGVETADYGWCDWWPKAITHNNNALNGTRHGAPRVGAVMWFNPGDQGAGSAGHWAYVESIGPNGWLLISEMNDTWRGGGWQRVNYRYVRVDGGTSFIY